MKGGRSYRKGVTSSVLRKMPCKLNTITKELANFLESRCPIVNRVSISGEKVLPEVAAIARQLRRTLISGVVLSLLGAM